MQEMTAYSNFSKSIFDFTVRLFVYTDTIGTSVLGKILGSDFLANNLDLIFRQAKMCVWFQGKCNFLKMF